nr:PAS domain-containing protein [Streptomyces sp. NBC_00857]
MSTGGNTSRDGQRRREPESAAVVVVDAHGLVTGWSKGAERLLGHSPAQIIGRPAAGLLASDPAAAAVESLGRGGDWRGTGALRHRDGHRLAVGLLVCPVLDEEGGSLGFVATALAEPEPAEDAPLTVEASVAQAPVAMSAFDNQHRSVTSTWAWTGCARHWPLRRGPPRRMPSATA